MYTIDIGALFEHVTLRIISSSCVRVSFSAVLSVFSFPASKPVGCSLPKLSSSNNDFVSVSPPKHIPHPGGHICMTVGEQVSFALLVECDGGNPPVLATF